MKHNHFIFMLALVATLCFSKLTAQTVYVTDAGKKYHAKNCSLVKTGKKGIELAEAKKQGMEPCKICKVEGVKPTRDKTKTGAKNSPDKSVK